MKQQTFNDGVATIYEVKNIADPGDMEKEGLEIRVEKLRYSEERVGITRFYNALQSQVKVDKLLRFPKIESISGQDIVRPIDGKHYKILQIQNVPNVEPPSIDISLERISAKHEAN